MKSEQRRDGVLRILTVSDKVEPVLYGPYARERVGKVDLILGCGDLPYDYLDYIASVLAEPLPAAEDTAPADAAQDAAAE